jgi:hypothetical protein
MQAAFLVVTLLSLASAAQAGVSCKFGSETIAAADVQTMFQYSASGQRGKTGKVSYFRLMTHDDAPGASSGIQVKTVDVMKPGDYAMTTEAGWTSVIRLHGKEQRVTAGKFSFTRFEVSGSRGHAAGTLEFTTAQTRGSCSFDVDVQALNRDTLPH